MATWTGRTIPSTTWGARPTIMTDTIYDNIYAYDVAIAYDGEIVGTLWTPRIIPT